MATKKQSRLLYEVFLERVIRIDAVQRHRAAVTDENTAQFFSEGCRPGVYGDFRWSLDAPKAFPRHEHFSLPMKPALDAAVAAFKEFIKALVNGELIANGEHPATSVRHDLDPAEWTRANLILDVRNGDLIEGRNIKHERRSSNGDLIEWRCIKHVRWSTITLRAAIQEKKLGTIDWDAEWNEDVARREKDQLPNEKAYVRELEARIKERYGVTSVDGGDLRRFKAALYRGDPVRPRKK